MVPKSQKERIRVKITKHQSKTTIKMKTDNEYLERAKEIISTAGISDNSIATMAIKYIFPELNQENTGDDAKNRNHNTNRVFPVIARENKTGKLIIINGGQLDYNGSDEYIKYVSDDGYHVYNPDEITFYDEYENPETEKETSDFKTGDWIVEELSGEWLVITDEQLFTYTAENRSGEQFFIQKESARHTGYHRWTQDDAKPGDVLADYAPDLDNPLSFILKDFKHIKYNLVRESDYHSFCYLKANERQQFCTGRWHHIHNLKPATAKQQELLFSKMKESGYSWNPESLELSTPETQDFNPNCWCICTNSFETPIRKYKKDLMYLFSKNTRSEIDAMTPAQKNNFRKWTIDDAKPGQVLKDKDGNIGRFQKTKEYSHCKFWYSYFYRNPSGVMYGLQFRIFEGTVHMAEGTQPASLDDIEFLSNGLTEAGYEWNETSCSLSKIQNGVNDYSAEKNESNTYRMLKRNDKDAKEILGKMQELLDNANKQGHDIVRVEDIENAFPELRKSECDRIRKEIIDIVKSQKEQQCHIDGTVYDKMITWLEKQGNITELSEEEQNKFAKNVLTSCASSFMNYLDAHRYEGKMCVSNRECEDIENAFHNAMWDRLHNYYCMYIEKQDEPKTCYDTCDSSMMNNKKKSTYGEKRDFGYFDEKPANKVEPKFKVDDWVVQKNSGVYKVIEICESWYEVIDFEDNHYSISFDKEYMCHLWSINDARNGDVLACNGSVFIFKEEYMAGKPTAYCGLVNGVFHVSSWCCWTNEKCYPSTKEQQNLLFSKMKASGWSWNPDTHELTRNEQ